MEREPWNGLAPRRRPTQVPLTFGTLRPSTFQALLERADRILTMLVGYARTSTLEQGAGLEAQVRDLKTLGCERLFQERVSSVGTRPQLAATLDFVRDGDTLIVTKLDRLARSVSHLGTILDALAAKGVALRIVSLGVDTSTPTGKLMLNVLGGIAQFEREMMLERQREGIAKAKAEGAYKGRKPTARARVAEIEGLAAKGLSMAAIAAQLGIGKGSVHRAIGKARPAPTETG